LDIRKRMDRLENFREKIGDGTCLVCRRKPEHVHTIVALQPIGPHEPIVEKEKHPDTRKRCTACGKPLVIGIFEGREMWDEKGPT
jgi:hypothetical protein